MKLKRSTRLRMASAVLMTTAFIVAATGIGGYWLYKDAEIRQLERKASDIAATVDTRIAEIERKRNEPVYIKLPGAAPVRAVVEDYTSSTSLWKLVSKQVSVDAKYAPNDLIAPEVAIRPNLVGEERTLRKEAAQKLQELVIAAKTDGHSLMINSAYRSSVLQQGIVDTYVATSGVAVAEQYSAYPGHSEHQLGLAVDLSTETPACYASTCSLAPAEAQWLAQNAHAYGFILRYPQGKEAITGFNFEPWHYRYVGVGLATALFQSGLTLEEAWPHLEAAMITLRENRALYPYITS